MDSRLSVHTVTDRRYGIPPLYGIVALASLLALSVTFDPTSVQGASTYIASGTLLYWLLFFIPVAIFGVALVMDRKRALLSPSGLPNLIVFATAALAGWINFRPSNEELYLALGRTVPEGVDSLLVLVSASFAVGSAIRFRRVPLSPSPNRVRQNTNTLHRLGRWALGLALAHAAYSALTSSVELRGVGHLDRGLESSIYVGVGLLRMVGTLAVLTPSQNNTKLVQRWYDWILILGPGILLATLGSRAVLATSLLLLLAVYLAKGTVGIGRITLAMLTVYFATAAILVYRSSGPWVSIFDFESVFDNTAKVVWNTVALTFAYVPSSYDYQLGGTYAVGALFLLSGPVARSFVVEGQTGTAAYRELVGFGSPNHGLGFSVPAEAWLNFGSVGIVLVPFLLAAFLALTWSWSDMRTLTARTSIYFILFAQFAVIWRSDSVGMFKVPIYSAIILAAFALIAHSRPLSRKATGAHRNSANQGRLRMSVD